jgi:hypothetical protein
MGEAGEEIRPGDRARIGVGDVDLDLREQDEQACEDERDPGLPAYGVEGVEVHVGGIAGIGCRLAVAKREIS